MQMHERCRHYCTPPKTTPCVPGAKENTNVLQLIQGECRHSLVLLRADETYLQWLTLKGAGRGRDAEGSILSVTFSGPVLYLGTLSTFTHKMFAVAS